MIFKQKFTKCFQRIFSLDGWYNRFCKWPIVTQVDYTVLSQGNSIKCWLLQKILKNHKNLYKKTQLDYLHNFQVTISCFIPNYNSIL